MKSFIFRGWLVINIIGLLGFFYLSKPLWETSFFGWDAGDGITFHLILIPIICLACLVNVLALVGILSCWKSPDFKRNIYFWFGMVACWVLDISVFWYFTFLTRPNRNTWRAKYWMGNNCLIQKRVITRIIQPNMLFCILNRTSQFNV